MNPNKWSKYFFNKYYLIIFLFLLFFLFRVPALNDGLFGDETYFYAFSVNTYEENSWGIFYEFYPVMFLPVQFYKISYMIFGDHIWAFRLVPLAFTFISLIIFYFLVKENYNKNAAYFLVFFAALNPWYTFSSTRLDYDSCILNFFFILCFYFFFRYLNKDKSIYLYLLGIALGFCIWIKFVSGFVLLFIIFSFLFYIKFKLIFKKDLKDFIIKRVSESIKILLPLSTLIILFFIGYSCLFGLSETLEIFFHFSRQSRGVFGFNILLLMQLMLPLLLISPLLLGSFVLYLVDKKNKKLNFFVYYLVIFGFFFITVTIMHNFRPLERYASIMILPMIVVCSVYVSKYINFRKAFPKILIFLLFFTSILMYITNTFFEKRILNFYPKKEILFEILKLKWNFLMPFTASAGPVGFYVNFLQLVIPFLVSFFLVILIIVFFRFKKDIDKKIIRLTLLLFISISLVYSIVILLEYDYSIQNYNIRKINNDLLSFADSINSNQTIYFFRNSFAFNLQVNRTDISMLDFKNEFDSDKIEEIIQRRNYILIQDFPQINKESYLWVTLKTRCEIIETFKSSDMALGYIFQC